MSVCVCVRTRACVRFSYQYVCSSEQVAEWVVQQVDEGSSVQVGVAHHLRGEQGLAGAAAEQTTHHAVAHVHVVGHFLEDKKRCLEQPLYIDTLHYLS